MKNVCSFMLLVQLCTFSCNLEKVTDPKCDNPASFSFRRLDVACASNCSVQFNLACPQNSNNYAWDFGDGLESTEKEPMHNYALKGTYIVALSVIQNGETFVQKDTVFIVAPQTVLPVSANAVKAFGYSVDISGDFAIVGAYQSTVAGKTFQGDAFVYHWNGTSWGEQYEIIAADGKESSGFGNSVAIDNDKAVIGSYTYTVGADDNRGAAYVYSRTGTNLWPNPGERLSENGDDDDYFGRAVDVAGNTIVATALRAGTDTSGLAFIYRYSGNTWVKEATLSNPNPSAAGEFGYCAALSAGYVAVGAHFNDISSVNQGAIYVFESQGATWNKIDAHFGENTLDLFGSSLSFHEKDLVVGARGAGAGKAYLLKFGGQDWASSSMEMAGTTGGEEFGWAVAMSEKYIVVGAPSQKVGNNAKQGVVYIFRRENLNEFPMVIKDPSGSANDLFGRSLALDGENLIVGAYGANTTGKAVFYRLD